MKCGRKQEWGYMGMMLLLLIFLLMVIVETAVSMYLNKGCEKEESYFVKWKKRYKQRKTKINFVNEKEES